MVRTLRGTFIIILFMKILFKHDELYTIRENDVLAMMNSALFSQNSNTDTNTSSITRI